MQITSLKVFAIALPKLGTNFLFRDFLFAQPYLFVHSVTINPYFWTLPEIAFIMNTKPPRSSVNLRLALTRLAAKLCVSQIAQHDCGDE